MANKHITSYHDRDAVILLMSANEYEELIYLAIEEGSKHFGKT